MTEFRRWYDRVMADRPVSTRYELANMAYNAGKAKGQFDCNEDIKAIMDDEIHFNGYSLTVRELIDGKEKERN